METRRFALDDQFWEINIYYSSVQIRWGLTSGLAKERTFHLEANEVAAKVAELVYAQLDKGYVEVSEAVRPAPRWWGRFERGAAYLEVGLDDCTVRQRRGEGNEQEIDAAQKSPTREDALEMVERITRLALATGYQLVREGEPAIRPALVFPELEAQCLANPGDPSAWAIYADWLLGQDDVRGELAALHLGGKLQEADLLLHEHRAEMFGVYADSWKNTIELSWRHGFVRGARIHSAYSLVVDDLVRDFLALPIARLVDSLDLSEAGAELDVICASAQAPWIRELRLPSIYDFATVWAKLPALEVLQAGSGRFEPGTFAHPRLKRFAFGSYRLDDQLIDVIAGARLPSLEALELEVGETAEPPLDAWRALFTADGFPALHRLGLAKCGYLDQLIPILAVTPMIRQLRTLDLGQGSGGRKVASALVAAKTSLAHLERIDLAGNPFNAQQRAQLAKELPNAVLGAQPAPEPPAPPRVRRPPPGPVQPIRRTRPK